MGDGPDAHPIFVGMDVHKATISIAVAGGARGGEVRQLGNFLNRADHVGKLIERLSKTGGQRLRFCYEAGPCGYGLARAAMGCIGKSQLLAMNVWSCRPR
jgi:transposase